MAKKKALPAKSGDDEGRGPETLGHDNQEISPDDDPFDALESRAMSIQCQLEVLKEVLRCDGVPPEFAAAAWVLGEMTEDFIRFREDLEYWHGGYDHTLRKNIHKREPEVWRLASWEKRYKREPEVKRLAQLPWEEYHRVRHEKAEALGVCVSTLDAEVWEKRPVHKSQQYMVCKESMAEGVEPCEDR